MPVKTASSIHNLVAQHVRSLRPPRPYCCCIPIDHASRRVRPLTSRVENSVEVPAKLVNEAGLAVQQVPAQALPAEWWTAYGDPLIDALVRNALEHNTDLAIARARIDEAVAITRRTRASMFPSLALTPQATRARDFLWHRPSAAMPGFRCRLHGKLI